MIERSEEEATGRLRLPDFMCIGAMRCGTTTLWELLDRHERVFLPDTKELHFFDDRDGTFVEGLEAYATHFEDAPADAVCGEFSPSYMFVRGTAQRIRSALPGVRLVAILRDPVERAWSHYWFNVQRGREWLSFEKAIESENERLASSDERVRNWFAYVTRGRYIEQLLEYERLFSREQLLVVLFDDLVTDAEAAMTRVFEHIGVDPIVDLRSATPWRNRGRRPSSRKIHYLSTQARSWSDNHGAITRQIVHRGTGLLRRINMSSEIPALDRATRERLAPQFAEANVALESWLARPLPWTLE